VHGGAGSYGGREHVEAHRTLEMQILTLTTLRLCVVTAKPFDLSELVLTEGVFYSEWCQDEGDRAAAGRVSETR
jgi:hypothetical protein